MPWAPCHLWECVLPLQMTRTSEGAPQEDTMPPCGTPGYPGGLRTMQTCGCELPHALPSA